MGFSYLFIAVLITTSSPAPDLQHGGEPVLVRALSGEELLRIGEIHDVQDHFPEALTYYEQSLQSFRSHKKTKGEATALAKIGLMFERQGRRSEAEMRLRQALSLFLKLPDSPVHADTLFALGRISLWTGTHEDAGRLFERAIDRYRRAGNAQAAGSAMIQLGLLKVSDGSPEEGFRMLQQVLSDARTRRDDGQILAALLALGDAGWIGDNVMAAKQYYEQALALVDQSPQASMEAGLRSRLAALSGITGQDEQGLQYARRAVTLYQALRDPAGEAASWSSLAALHRALGQQQEAEEALQRALVLYRQRQLVVHAARSTPDLPRSKPR